MSDLIKKIKIKKQDGTFTDYIPIGAEAQNVSTSDGDSVQLKLNKKPYYYNTVADMKADTKLKAGDMTITLGYYNENDDGGATYLIRERTSNDVEDNGSIHFISDSLVAELVVENDTVNVKQFGAKGDGTTDDTTFIQNALNFSKTNKTRVFIPSGTFLVSQLIGHRNITLYGENKKNTVLKSVKNNNITTGLLCFLEGEMNYITLRDFSFEGNKNNNTSEFSGLYIFTSGYKYGDCYSVIENLEISNCTGNGVSIIGAGFVEGRLINVRSQFNNKNGFYINGPTDCMFEMLTGCFNKECGYYIKGANHKISNCKAHTNGVGDFKTYDYERCPVSAYEITNDTSYNSDKIYFTRSGAGYDDNMYKFTKFDGSSFESGVTYYEMNKPYYKKFPGFYLETNRCIYSNIEAQDNSGDGIYLYGFNNTLSPILCDSNGRLTNEDNIMTSISYESVGIEPLYDGVHIYYYGPNNIDGSFCNFRYQAVGLNQRYAICCNKAKPRLTANINYSEDQMVGGFKLLNNAGDSHHVIVNGILVPYEYDTSRIVVNEEYEFKNEHTRPSTIKKYGNKAEISLYVKKKEGNIPTSQTADTIIGTLPKAFKPKDKVSLIGIITSSGGYAHTTYCACNIQTNGQIVFRNTETKTGSSIIIRGYYECA